jgi:hypothetical protein
MFVPGTLKQTLCQPEYLMSRAARWPRNAKSWPVGVSLAELPSGFATCCADALVAAKLNNTRSGSAVCGLQFP